MMWLSVSSAERSAKPVHLGVGTYVLGRDVACDVAIDDPHVSLRHAQLDVTKGGVRLLDLGSTNGTTFAGDQLNRPILLHAPAEFLVGHTTVRISPDEPTETIDISGVKQSPSAAGPPAATASPASYNLSDAGPAAGRDVGIRAGRDAAGRDIIIHEGMRLQTRFRRSAKNCMRLGAVLLLAGFGLFSYFVITWNSEIFDVVNDPSMEPPSDLPSPLPWLPLGAALMFSGVVLIVIGLLIPRDRIVTRSER